MGKPLTMPRMTFEYYFFSYVAEWAFLQWELSVTVQNSLLLANKIRKMRWLLLHVQSKSINLFKTSPLMFLSGSRWNA